MADEQYGWLDRETAERLLRGEPLDAVGADAREQAERLAEALGALSSQPAASSTELPGEAAALAAFRSARADRPTDFAEGADAPAARGRAGASDAGLFRLDDPEPVPGRPRWARPLRYVLVAALAVGMVGGVAVAAGTGVLPTPFDDAEPAPASSVSAAATPRQPSTTPSPDAPGDTAPSEGSSGPGGAGRDIAGGGDPAPGDRSGVAPDIRESTGRALRETASACRAVRDGRHLGTDRKRALEGAAGGSGRVWTYCKGLLAELDTLTHRGNQGGNAQGDARNGEAGRSTEHGDGDSDGNADEGNSDDRHRAGRDRGSGDDGRGDGDGADGGRADDGRGDGDQGRDHGDDQGGGHDGNDRDRDRSRDDRGRDDGDKGDRDDRGHQDGNGGDARHEDQG
ncbi:hypothetical protein ABZZ79_34300 [Streptomyces sp. NPDC006458]|uniref:hypothetical protein n=1 Tax=Streptomyces sp. NPDC006458 TaxID=3154302 RepID=UPI0033B141F6